MTRAYYYGGIGTTAAGNNNRGLIFVHHFDQSPIARAETTMKHLNLLKSSLAAAATAFTLGTGTLVRANPPVLDVANGTYTFTATDGHTMLNGSWVTFSNDVITAWNLVDSTALSANSFLTGYTSYGYPIDFPPLTLANSSIVVDPTYSTGSGPNAFSFTIASPVGALSAASSIFYFEGANNVIGQPSALYDGATYNQTLLDPIGNWTWRGASAAPDSASTFGLLLGASAVLGACKSVSRRRAGSRR